MLRENRNPSTPAVLAPARGDEHPDWDVIPFDVPCSRCGKPVNGAQQPVCRHCGAALRWEDLVPVEHLRCRHCQYQVLGLSEQRCPECGEAFTWEEVLQAARQRRSELFEYLWRDRPLDSLGRTWLTAAFRPLKLWRQYDRYAPIAIIPLLVFVLAQWTTFIYGWDAAGWIAQRFMNTLAGLIGSKYTFQYTFRVGPQFPIFIAAWYLATFLSLQIFYWSKRRHDVNWLQILRVYVHATAFAALIPAISCVLEMLLDSSLLIKPDLNTVLNTSRPNPYLLVRDAAFALGVVVTWLHLWLGYSRYLNHPRGWGIAATTLVLGYYLARLVLLYL